MKTLTHRPAVAPGLPDAASDRQRSEGGTREAVIRQLLECPASAAEVAERLSMSAAGIRRHLDVLVDEGAVASREVRTHGPRGRGRPAREYLLTDAGRRRLPHAYDALAIEAIDFVDEVAGADGVMAFARRRAESLIADARPALAAAPDLPARLAVLAGALTGAGFSASVAEVNAGSQLCQHHCPVAHVAVKFPQLCQAELDVFAEAVGTHAQRLATIARGDSFCTTFVPGATGAGTPEIPVVPDRTTGAVPATIGRNS